MHKIKFKSEGSILITVMLIISLCSSLMYYLAQDQLFELAFLKTQINIQKNNLSKKTSINSPNHLKNLEASYKLFQFVPYTAEFNCQTGIYLYQSECDQQELVYAMAR